MKKIVIIGPESTGKSTLCEQLATHFNTDWVREYAREYLLKNGTDYTYADLWTIACGQIKGEDEMLQKQESNPQNSGLLIIDTDFSVMKVWSEFVFNSCDNRILTGIVKRSYDMYLLCATDLPWVADELREYPNLEIREKLFHYYKEFLINQSLPWHVIQGNYQERFASAVQKINTIL